MAAYEKGDSRVQKIDDDLEDLDRPSKVPPPAWQLQLKEDIAGMAPADQLKALEPPRKSPFPLQRKASGGENTADIHEAAAEGVSGSGAALPHLDRIQQSFGGFDVSGVNAHVGGKAARASESIGALAYARGSDIAFKSTPDLHTAAHEAAHVVQQAHGVSLPGGVGSVGDKYEQHADAVADKVVSGQSAEGLLGEMGGGAPVQRKEVQLSADETAEKAPDVEAPADAATWFMVFEDEWLEIDQGLHEEQIGEDQIELDAELERGVMPFPPGLVAQLNVLCFNMTKLRVSLQDVLIVLQGEAKEIEAAGKRLLEELTLWNMYIMEAMTLFSANPALYLFLQERQMGILETRTRLEQALASGGDVAPIIRETSDTLGTWASYLIMTMLKYAETGVKKGSGGGDEAVESKGGDEK